VYTRLPLHVRTCRGQSLVCSLRVHVCSCSLHACLRGHRFMQPHEYLARYSRVCVVPVAREGALAKNKSKHARTNNKQLLAPARAHMQGQTRDIHTSVALVILSTHSTSMQFSSYALRLPLEKDSVTMLHQYNSVRYSARTLLF
jgi:hypothetical protein